MVWTGLLPGYQRSEARVYGQVVVKVRSPARAIAVAARVRRWVMDLSAHGVQRLNYRASAAPGAGMAIGRTRSGETTTREAGA